MLRRGGGVRASGLGGEGTAAVPPALPTHLYTSRTQVMRKETPTLNM